MLVAQEYGKSTRIYMKFHFQKWIFTKTVQNRLVFFEQEMLTRTGQTVYFQQIAKNAVWKKAKEKGTLRYQILI